MMELLTFKVVLLFLCLSRASLAQLDVADPLDCPSGTLAYGLTLFIPESVYWRDPDLGPPPLSNAPMPISVCLLCHRITAPNITENHEFETLQTENRNVPAYQTCIGKGDLSRTVSQTFDCYDKSYLRHFHKQYKDMNSTYGCAKVENQDKVDIYDTSFNLEQANSRTRANWRDLTVNLTCPEDKFLCGLELLLDGKYPSKIKEPLEMESEENQIKIERHLRGPNFIAKCCNLAPTPSSNEKYVVSNELNSCPFNFSSKYDQVAVIVLSILLSLLMLVIFLCVANLLCCPCVKQITKKAKVDDHEISSNSSGDFEEDVHEERNSVFNSRPPTVTKNSGIVSIHVKRSED